MRVTDPAALARARRAAQLTQLDLARCAGISQPAMSQIENGVSSCSPETAARIARRLQMPVEDLFASSKAPAVA